MDRFNNRNNQSIDDILAELGYPTKAPSGPSMPEVSTPAKNVTAPTNRPTTPSAQRPVKPAQHFAEPVQKSVNPTHRPSTPVQKPSTPIQRPASASAQKPVQPSQRPISAQATQTSTRYQGQNSPVTSAKKDIQDKNTATQVIPEMVPLTSTVGGKATAVAKKKKKKKPFIWRFLNSIIPKKGDTPFELVRKIICMIAVIVLVVSSCVLVNDFIIVPLHNSNVASSIDDLLNPLLTPEEANFLGYPSGILDKFKKLYYANNDTIGWVKIPSDSSYFHGVDYVVTQTNDNDYYLTHDFYKKENKNGCICMDYRCDYSSSDLDHRITILYGHNMKSGQMFASLNQMLGLDFARSAPIIQFSSLYQENKYLIFAIDSIDTTEASTFNILNPDLNSDEEFLKYVAECRLRSWHNYSAVDVRADDELLVLYTCSNTYQTTMGKEGRTVVVARKVRPGESIQNYDVGTITNNSNTLMPRQWYANKGKSLPNYLLSTSNATSVVQKMVQTYTGSETVKKTQALSKPNSSSGSSTKSGSVQKKKSSTKTTKKSIVTKKTYSYYYDDDDDYNNDNHNTPSTVSEVTSDIEIVSTDPTDPVEPVETDPTETTDTEPTTPVEETTVSEEPQTQPEE